MFNYLYGNSLDITCDAPSYAVVRACRRIGVRNPEDVRWCRFRAGHKGRWTAWLHLRAWKKILSGGEGAPSRCTCGQALPEPMHCTFTFADGQEVDYVIGQCRRCQTVFWDEP
jgi:hypothetical protein